ncbi:MAG TPA: hypothetical protein DCG33_06505 [Prevotellaceae bacterium]|nr:hypothetical protein [Prevotellaceae bacterium]
MIRHFILLIVITCMPLFAFAQTENGTYSDAQDSIRDEGISTMAFTGDSTLFYSALPTWEHFTLSPLHAGFNASLSMFASIGLGHHSPNGVGFGKSISFAYAKPLEKRWTYIVAANANSMKWGSINWNQLTLGGELNYAYNDRLSFSVVGYKELVHPNAFLPCYYNYANPFMLNHDSYVGGAVNMKFNDNFFMQVSFGTGTIKDR